MTPPRLAVWLLTRLVPDEIHEALLGDLEEEYRTRILPARGRRSARRWFWRQTLAAVPLLRTKRYHPPTALHTPGPLMLDFLHEIRLAARRLRRTPGFAVMVVLILALGIGASTAIFSVANPVLFESLPYPRADRLVLLGETNSDGTMSNMGFATYTDVRRDSRRLEAVAAMSYWTPVLGGDAEPERVFGQAVTHDFFRVLGVAPALGRGFLDEEDARGRNRVAVLSHGLWQRRYGGDSSLVGRQILVSGAHYTVVGVMPASFESLLAPEAVIWRPLGYDPSLSWACRTCRHLRIVGRVVPGATRESLDRELDLLSARYVQDHPTEYARAGMEVIGLQEQLVSGVRGALLVVLGAVGVLLLMATTNVANLALGRAIQRESEFGIRAALGAGRFHIVRQLVAESTILSVLGGLAGLALAWLGARTLVAMGPKEIPRLDAVRLDADAVLFAVFVVVGVAFLTGLAPGFAVLRTNLFDSVRRGAAATTAARGRRLMRSGLVVMEMALAFTLLAGAGLLIRSVQRLLSVNPGFESTEVLTMSVQASGPAYADDAAVRAVQDRVLEAVRALPAVQSAVLTTQIPLGGNFDAYGVMAQDKPLANPEDAPAAQRYVVSPGYLSALRIPIRRGRGFVETDREDAPPVALVNEALAHALWKGEEALGKRIRMGDPNGPWREVVGIVGNTLHLGLDADVTPQFYVPLRQWPWADNPLILVARVAGEPSTLVPPVRAAIASAGKDLAISEVASMSELMARSAAQRRFAKAIFQAFAVAAVVLAAAGLFGVLAGSVTERTREMGIRSALGASRRRLLRLILRDGLALAGIGLIAGIAGALGLARVLQRLLFDISPHDPATLLAVTTLLLVVAVGACLVPAWRAAQADPVTTLKSG
jgi:putative ABC transport system permease protein